MTTENEIAMTGTMILSAAWTMITGDTFLPSLAGAGFATYLRSQSKEVGVDMIDLVVGAAVSVVVGLIAGPYIGSQLPNGDGVVGVGALIASFMAVGFFTRLHALDWNIVDLLKEIAAALPGGKGNAK